MEMIEPDNRHIFAYSVDTRAKTLQGNILLFEPLYVLSYSPIFSKKKPAMFYKMNSHSSKHKHFITDAWSYRTSFIIHLGCYDPYKSLSTSLGAAVRLLSLLKLVLVAAITTPYSSAISFSCCCLQCHK